MLSRIFLIVFVCQFVFISRGWSFAQNVTHGYPACISCHYSPNGGGLLTDYGRSLSKELMSTWGVGDAFAKPFFGAPVLEKVKYGGDVRAIQTYLENDNVKTGRAFVMQTNVEVGVVQDNVMFVGTLGLQQGPDSTPNRGKFLSERHYVLWSPSPTSRLRAGKFRQTYGINTPNHTRLIKNRLGFGSLSETYNLEYSQFFENSEITVGSSLGRIDEPRDPGSERNISGHYTWYGDGNSRIGGSLLFGESPQERRFLLGANAIFPMGKHWLAMLELDFEQSQVVASPNNDIDTLISYIQVGNKPFKGLMWYLVFEHLSQSGPAGAYNLITQPGIGVQWLPIPHLNLQVEYSRSESSQVAGNINHIGWVLFHLYL